MSDNFYCKTHYKEVGWKIYKTEQEYIDSYNEDNKLTRHNLDGPAVIWANGTQSWFKDDLWHREDGPARVHADGDTSWWLKGIMKTKEYSLPLYVVRKYMKRTGETLTTMLVSNDEVLRTSAEKWKEKLAKWETKQAEKGK